jgi:MoxR-like ATPase
MSPGKSGTAASELLQSLTDEIGRVVRGHDEAIELLLAALASGGHVLLEGPPGTGKTLLATAMARSLGLEFRRVQFTPDMLPSDLTGTLTLRGSSLVFQPGPVFTNILLADEVNRTPPKTQAALLESMQEHQVSVEGEPQPLPDPFLVLATQNPIEYEGTYPLPEAQLDRFLFQAVLSYPPEQQEREMLETAHRGVVPVAIDDVRAVAGARELERLRQEADETSVSDEVADYLIALIRRTRELPSIELGASPRAAIHLLAAAKAAARIEGRDFVTPDDIGRMALPVLRHRLILRPEAELEQYRSEQAIATALAEVPVPR